MSVPPPPPPLPDSPPGEQEEQQEQQEEQQEEQEGGEEQEAEDALRQEAQEEQNQDDEYVPQSPSEDEPPPLPPSPSSPSKQTKTLSNEAATNETADTVEQLAKKLQEHKDQLHQVEQMLMENPEDETLLKLKADLTQVVSLTEDLTRGAPPEGDEEEYEEEGDDEKKDGDNGQAEGDKPLSISAMEEEDKVAEAAARAILEGEQRVPSVAPDLGDDDLVSSMVTEKKWSIGDRCQALWEDGKWYNARIDGVTAAENFNVTYLDFGNTSDVPESSLKPYIPASEGLLSQGVKVKAIYQEDGLFYDAVIESVLEPGLYAIKYLKWKKKATI